MNLPSNFSELNSARANETDVFDVPMCDFTDLELAAMVAGQAGKICSTISATRSENEADPFIATKEDVARKIADVVIYLDLLATKLEINLSDEVVTRFNRVSASRGSKHFLNKDYSHVNLRNE